MFFLKDPMFLEIPSIFFNVCTKTMHLPDEPFVNGIHCISHISVFYALRYL